MTSQPHDYPEILLVRLVRYLRDCLAAQNQWARAVNVLRQKDMFLVPLTRRQQARFGQTGSLALRSSEALELGDRLAVGGSRFALRLGALFLVGRTSATGKRPERRYCAPLLEVPLRLRRDLRGQQIVVEPEEVEFTVNYSFVSEILRVVNKKDLQDRLTDLVDLVPDFPIHPSEFRDFWNGFRMIAAGLPICQKLPRPRRGKGVTIDPDGMERHLPDPAADVPSSEGDPRAPTRQQRRSDVDDPRPLELIDFFIPAIPRDYSFHLLPATTLILGRRAGHVFSALTELDNIAQQPLDQTALGYVFDPASARPPESRPAREIILDDAFPLPLTRTQEAVVRSARSAPLTVVTGPPGTGKSYTITAIVLDALLRGRSVLVASQMDKAVEVVAKKVEEIAGPLALARSGGRAAQRQLAKKIARLTGAKAGGKAVTDTASKAERQKAARHHHELSQRITMLEQRYLNAVQREQAWSECQQSYERLAPVCPLPVHELSRRTLHRAERAARRAHKALDGQSVAIRRWWGHWQMWRARRLLRVPSSWQAGLDEIDELVRVQALRVTMRETEKTLGTPFPADLLWQQISHLGQRSAETALKLLRLNREAVLAQLTCNSEHRSQLRFFRTLLLRRNPKLKRELRSKIDPTVPLRAFPAWASTNRAMGQVLTATPGVFDLVVIDEASQCEMATAAVALFRGKRAVVVGDPNQLRHVCFLGRAREQAAFTQHGLSRNAQERFHYRRSLFDVAADAVPQDRFFMLDQHFRSDPHIIAFSNRKFYDGKLAIMTERPRQQAHSAIRVVRTDGNRSAGTSVNPVEVAAVLSEVAAVVEATAPNGPAPTLAIVSPFRDQVDAISDRLIRQFPARVIDRHEILVGTAHTLQGDEKDIVILSTSIDSAFHSASLRFLENPNLFNVAVTRARHRMVVVTSVGIDDLPSGLLREYLEHARGTLRPHQPIERYDNSLAKKLAMELTKQGLEVWPSFPAAGVSIDLVATKHTRHVAILCEGPPPGPGQRFDPLTRHRMLVRAGWSVNRISQRAWCTDWYACVEHVIQTLRS